MTHWQLSSNRCMRIYLDFGTVIVSLLLFLALLICAVAVSATAHASPETSNPPEATERETGQRTMSQEIERFRGTSLSLMDAIRIVETRSPGSKVVDISFDGQSEKPVYRVKSYLRDKVMIGGVDASTGSIFDQEIEKPAWSLDNIDRIELSGFKRLGIDFSDVVPIAEKFSSGSALSAGLQEENGKLTFLVVVLVHGGLEQISIAPDKARRPEKVHLANCSKHPRDGSCHE